MWEPKKCELAANTWDRLVDLALKIKGVQVEKTPMFADDVFVLFRENFRSLGLCGIALHAKVCPSIGAFSSFQRGLDDVAGFH